MEKKVILVILGIDDRTLIKVHGIKCRYCWFSHDVTKLQTSEVFDPPEILLSCCIKAAKN